MKITQSILFRNKIRMVNYKKKSWTFWKSAWKNLYVSLRRNSASLIPLWQNSNMILKEIRFFEKSLYLSKEKWCTVNFTLTPRHFNSLQTKVSHINCFNTNRNSKSLPHAFENFCARKIFVSCLLSCDNSVFKKKS